MSYSPCLRTQVGLRLMGSIMKRNDVARQPLGMCGCRIILRLGLVDHFEAQKRGRFELFGSRKTV